MEKTSHHKVGKLLYHPTLGVGWVVECNTKFESNVEYTVEWSNATAPWYYRLDSIERLQDAFECTFEGKDPYAELKK